MRGMCCISHSATYLLRCWNILKQTSSCTGMLTLWNAFSEAPNAKYLMSFCIGGRACGRRCRRELISQRANVIDVFGTLFDLRVAVPATT